MPPGSGPVAQGGVRISRVGSGRVRRFSTSPGPARPAQIADP